MNIVKIHRDLNNASAQLEEDLRSLDEGTLTIVSSEDLAVQFENEEIQHLFGEFHADIVFAASANFPFDVSGINLYYWKYYPREQGSYHFVHSGMMAGKASDLLQLISDIRDAYGEDILQKTLLGTTDEVDAFHRYYIDLAFGLETNSLSVTLDRDQKLFGVSNGRRSVVKWPMFTLRHGLIFYKYEKAALQDDLIGTREWDFVNYKGKVRNKRINSIPAIISKPALKKASFRDKLSSFGAYVHSLVTIIKMLIYNGGKRKDHEIFRFRHNQNSEISHFIEQLIGYLENGTAFSFTHFNDGEMTFIKKFEKQDHKEVWFGSYFGRIQDKYNKQLGELLKAAFLKRQENYFIGIPCSTCHPKLSEYAKVMRPVDDYTIPAMTFHHNLSKYPRILGAIRKKKVYFVVNINQDLTFFKKMGFAFEDEQIIRVPFRNAHEQYNTLKDHTFEDGSVVMLMSGMLAKILCAHWFEHNSKTSFIAFGSSFDDYIQSKINFNLYPKDFPFSKTLIGSRSYLFGYKSHCDECYDMTEPNPGI